uniref:Uncharacterized protein n=1 Tax=Arundo donax TaxID=35708 RepID=A0A0A8ZUE9_ARUDO
MTFLCPGPGASLAVSHHCLGLLATRDATAEQPAAAIDGRRLQQGRPELVPHHPQVQGGRRRQPPKSSPLPQWPPRDLPLPLTNGASPPAPAPLHCQDQDHRPGGTVARSRLQPPVHSPKPQDSEWVFTVRGKLAQARAEEVACPWARLSVYRVPKYLRDGDERAYTPQVVSIGPLHHGRRRLREMERH